MGPVVWGTARTTRGILAYTLITVAAAFALLLTGVVGLVYAVVAAACGALFVRYALRLRRQATSGAAMRLFAYSIVYLFLLFAAMVADQAARSLGGVAL